LYNCFYHKGKYNIAPRVMVQGTRYKGQGSRGKVQGANKMQSAKCKVQNTKADDKNHVKNMNSDW